MEDVKDDIRFKLTKELYVSQIEGRLYSLRLGKWVVNGIEGELILEKRGFWRSKSGSVMPGKAQGLTNADMYRIMEFLPELSRLMDFPLIKPKDQEGRPL